ncbi:MAG: hypothetical protein DWQ51_19040 [Microcystis wesenbergii TW10]|jgi:hypothetical protein|uniref:Uncharacterized protein n=4 Tax=Microcystis TaxID=1125 RepID=A0A0A1VZP3_MICAE|nr:MULTISPECIES: hypothetical protein [Microcystis]MCZ8096815.1 hypothetical protein [Burkholderiales bacterium]REJ48367.1 MAG: hypothetical protein DWQ51_19040 [Microcystis wesenbergii TW10]TRT84714.1 MAG: hypothetical protein EWV63_14650 [Microcystis aeruginosa Ma_OC_H_19870700_S124]MBD2115322.1 hypothetical protein [Microcystis wesenbergii FACHB-1339]MCZ8038469.1 hypothetical protein [Microcystis sp. LE17-20A]
MTELWQQAIAEIEKLSPNQEDAIASRLLAEVQDEQQWETSFNKTTDDKWDKMAEMVRQEIRNSKTVLLNQIFPE